MTGTFRVAPAIHFGYGIAGQTGELTRSLGVSRVLLVCDPGFRSGGIL
jgi:alcohol dehydrogenase class IV